MREFGFRIGACWGALTDCPGLPEIETRAHWHAPGRQLNFGWPQTVNYYACTQRGRVRFGKALKVKAKTETLESNDIQSTFVEQLRKLDSKNPEDAIRAATLVCNLGHIYHETGAVDDAEANYLCALEIYLERLGSAHPFVATTLNNLGSLFCETGRYKQSLDAHTAALRIERRMFGKSHPAIAATLNNLGFLCETRKEFGKAKTLYHRAYLMYRENEGANDPQTRVAHRNWRRALERLPHQRVPIMASLRTLFSMAYAPKA